MPEGDVETLGKLHDPRCRRARVFGCGIHHSDYGRLREALSRPRALESRKRAGFHVASPLTVVCDMPDTPRVLVADDQPAILEALRLLLDDAGFDTDLVSSVERVRERVAADAYDLLLMDLNYDRDTTSGREGLDLLTEIHRRDRELPIVVMTGWGNVDMAVDAMRRGARSFVQKPWDNRSLIDVLTREVHEGRSARFAHERTRHDRDEAMLIQRALLPDVLPSIDGCDLAVAWKPAAGLGGDCYDALRFSDTRIGLSIADVIGKGLPAALLMSSLQTSMRAFATEHVRPADVASRVNRLLCRGIASGKFVTCCYAVVDTATSRLAFCNAGHNPPLLVHADRSVERLLTTGLVLGVQPDCVYHQGEVALSAGDRVVLFTDGITEAERADGEQFSDERLIELVVAHRRSSARELVDTILTATSEFADGSLQDDATVMVAALL